MAASRAIAKRGSHPWLGLQVVLPLMQRNCERNGFRQGRRPPEGQGHTDARELEWGSEGYMDTVGALAPADFVLAADCCYVDGIGVTPSTEHFVRAARGLCGPSSSFLVASEIRSSEVRWSSAPPRAPSSVRSCMFDHTHMSWQVRDEMVALLHRHFGSVDKLPLRDLPPAFQIEHIELFECKP